MLPSIFRIADFLEGKRPRMRTPAIDVMSLLLEEPAVPIQRRASRNPVRRESDHEFVTG